jgi:cytidylate kinase
MDVTEEIRSQIVTKHVSEVSALAPIREAMVQLQRRFSEGINSVFEGRDLGSVVFPHAELKIFLTASPEVRAERRFRELVFKHPSEAENMTKQQVFEDLLRRDSYDSSRQHSPLRPADDAVIVDTSDLAIEEVVEKIFIMFQEILKK